MKITKARATFVTIMVGLSVLLLSQNDDRKILEQFKLQLAESNERVESLEEKIRFIQENYGNPHLYNILDSHHKYKSHLQDGVRVRMGGFEKIKVNNSELKNVWTEEGVFPLGTMDNVDSIVYVGRDYAGLQLVFYFNFWKFGAAAQSMQDLHQILLFRVPEKFYKSKEELLRRLDGNIGEEVGHMNDWVASRNMTIGERLNMFYDVGLTHMSNNFDDPRKFIYSIWSPLQKDQNSLQITELWGGLCDFYFNNPAWLYKKYPAEYALVTKWVARFDPSYNPLSARNRRWYLIHGLRSLKRSEHVEAERQMLADEG